MEEWELVCANHLQTTLEKSLESGPMKKPKIELKLESLMAEINKIKNPIISEGRKPTSEEEAEIQELRDHIKNLEEMRRIIQEAQLKSEKDNR